MQDPAKNFAENLGFLAKSGSTISNLCSEIGINRQQFNKYLSGRHLPSRRNLAIIARHFSISDKDFFSSPSNFRSLYTSANRALIHVVNSSSFIHHHAAEILKNSQSMAEYVGIYCRYQVSSIYPNTVLRSIMRIYEKDGFIFYYYIERFRSLDQPHRVAFTFRYHGICNLLDGKIFLIDAETVQKNEMTFAALTPIARKPMRMLLGIASGVAANAVREPFSTKVALVMTGKGPLRPSDFRMSSSLSRLDPAIPEEVRLYLGIVGDEKGAMIRSNA